MLGTALYRVIQRGFWVEKERRNKKNKDTTPFAKKNKFVQASVLSLRGITPMLFAQASVSQTFDNFQSLYNFSIPGFQ